MCVSPSPPLTSSGGHQRVQMTPVYTPPTTDPSPAGTQPDATRSTHRSSYTAVGGRRPVSWRGHSVMIVYTASRGADRRGRLIGVRRPRCRVPPGGGAASRPRHRVRPVPSAPPLTASRAAPTLLQYQQTDDTQHGVTACRQGTEVDRVTADTL